MPYCETHYHAKRGSLCAGCSKPITGRCITAMFRKFHPEHFVCAFCLKQLNKGTFKGITFNLYQFFKPIVIARCELINISFFHRTKWQTLLSRLLWKVIQLIKHHDENEILHKQSIYWKNITYQIGHMKRMRAYFCEIQIRR